MLQPIPGHYRMFITAAHHLWIGQPGYGVPFAGNLFFYSPAFALVFFGPLSLLPEKLGLFIYLILSLILLIYGIIRFTRLFEPSSKMNFFWILLAQPLFSALGVHKPEIMIVGLILLCAGWTIEGKRPILSALILGMVSNWKIQPLPAVALLMTYRALKLRDFRFPFWVVFSFLFWFVLPFILRPWSLMVQANQAWRSSLEAYSRASYIEFDNIYSFLQNSCGVSLNYFSAQILSLGGAVLTGVFYIAWFMKRTLSLEVTKQATLLALAAGLAYTVIFSPLQQVQAYILLTPLYFTLCLTAKRSSRRESYFWWGLIVCTFLIMSFAYSDLIPLELRYRLRHGTIRSGMAALLAITLWVRVFFPRWIPDNTQGSLIVNPAVV